jgi:hypothetical protein
MERKQLFFKIFLNFIFCGISTHFNTIISKTSTLSNGKKKVNQGKSKSANLDFAGLQKKLFSLL